MINEIINRLEADIFFFDSNIGIAPNIKIGLEIAKEIVQEVAKEYGKDTNVSSKDEVANEHRKLNRCDTCTYYEKGYEDGAESVRALAPYEDSWVPCSERLPELVKNKYRVAFEHIVNCDRDASYLSDAYRNDLTDLLELINKYESNGWISTEKELPTKRDWYLAVFKEPDTDFVLIPQIADYLLGAHTNYTTEEGWIIANCTDIEEERAEYYKKLKCIAWQPLPAPFKKGE